VIKVDVSRRVIAAMGAVLILSGCTTTVAGSAQPAPRPTGEAEITADPTPAPEIGDGTLVEAQRIAGATVLPEFVYPELTNSCFPTVPIIYPERMEGTIFIEGTASAIYTTYGFVAGWSTCRNTLEGDRSALVFVAEMSDRDSAAVAARELADSFVEVNGAEPTEIRGFENLPAVETVSVEDGEDRIVYEVLQPVGRMLAYFFYSDSDLDAAQDDVGELLEEQRQLLGDFEPTPQEEVADLDPDIYDLARRVVDPPVDADLFTGSYDLQGYLHLAIDPQIESQLLPGNGFRGAYLKTAADDATGFSYQFQVYELGSVAEADAVFAEFARIEREEFSDRVMFQVPEDPTIPCFYTPAATAGDPIFQRCYTREGRFLGGTDVFGVTDPADITAVRGFVQEQIRLMQAP